MRPCRGPAPLLIWGAVVACAAATPDHQTDAGPLASQAVARAAGQVFHATLLIRLDEPAPSVGKPKEGVRRTYLRATVAPGGFARLDEYCGADEPAPDAVPERSAALTPDGRWRVLWCPAAGRPQLDFVRSVAPQEWGEFPPPPGGPDPELAASLHELLVNQRASEMLAWQPWSAALEKKQLRGQFLSGPAKPRTFQTVYWRRHGADWLIDSIVRFSEAGASPFSQEFQDYRSLSGARVAHKVTEWQHCDGPSRTYTLVRATPSTSVDMFRPPVLGDPQWRGTWLVQELTKDGWRSALLGIHGEEREARVADLFARPTAVKRFVPGVAQDEPAIVRSLRALARREINADVQRGE